MKITKVYLAILLGLSIFVFAVLSRSLNNYPQMPEEKIYGRSALSFIEWIKHPHSFQREVLAEYWNTEGEHPSIVKILSSLSWSVFHKKLGDLFSLRFATVINFSILLILIYVFAHLFLSGPVSLCGCILLLCIPFVIEGAHFAEININLTLFWILASYFFFRAQSKGRIWICISGGIAGLATGAKITTLIVPVAIVFWLLLYNRKELPINLFLFTVTGVMIFWATWPSLWISNPIRDIVSHIKYHAPEISKGYPWYFVFQSFFSVVPPGFIALFPLGIIKIFLDKNKGGIFCLILLLIFLGFFSIFRFYPSDWRRYLLPLMPFFSIICATGLDFLIRPVIKRKIVYV